MTNRLKKTAIIALAVGLIAEGSKAVAGGNLKQGGLMVAVGILVVYGYEVMQELQVMELAGGLIGESKTEEGKGE